ncbi:uncharacterized protein EDB93DRAFT_670052 [Suillus bovinus]|uniref:uncharacterized protein n=1 Tax=Suillus bovinus TaxID=48563 RepID=UPI001B865540|nr:uncharacterized protein EDB93DRAFT_670052 [Suillus bovinus]KAG2158445.1 hypothetical protein EDB93DRAFT_670052 [Suillus bovinus]
MSFPWFRMTLLGGGLMGLGYLLMSATVPTPEQTYAAMAPDLRRKVDANRAARALQEQTIKRQVDAQSDPDAGKPIWAEQQNQR